jgi:hypothetical protein
VPECHEHRHAPWYVVPADDKKNARLIISEILLDVFKGLKMAYPEPTAKREGIEIHPKAACEVTFELCFAYWSSVASVNGQL